MTGTRQPDPQHHPEPDGETPDYRRLFDLTGRRALVVGAGGIGAEVCAALAQHGAMVTAADLDADIASAAAQRCADHGGIQGQHLVLDATDPVAVQALADRGSPDVLVTTVGANVRKPLRDYTDDEFDRVLGVNLRSVFNLIRSYGPAMAAAGHGSFIAFSSIRGRTVEPGQGVYAAAKAGLQQLLAAAAAEHGPAGVRFNAVAPGVVATPLTAQIRAKAAWDAAYASKSALGRWARPDEIAGAVVYLASDAASFVTGSVLAVDGGWTAVDGRFDPFAPDPGR